MRNAQCAMRNAQCAMRNAQCAMRNAQYVGPAAKDRGRRPPMSYSGDRAVDGEERAGRGVLARTWATRRQALKGALALGVAGSGLGSLLAACGGGAPAPPASNAPAAPAAPPA